MLASCIYSLFTHDYRQMAREMFNSVKRFYPLVPVNLIEIENYNYEAFTDFAAVGAWMAERYERVIFMGIDQIMCAPCPDLFYKDGVLAPPNNTNYITQFPQTVNGGLVASTDKRFWDDWYQRLRIDKDRGETNVIQSQNLLNEIFWSGRYKTEVMQYSDRSYGTDTLDQYGAMTRNGIDLYCGDKKICIFHAAGDYYKKGNMIQLDLIPEGPRKRLRELIHD